MDSSIFRAYDVRGTVPSQINGETATLLGRASAVFFRAHLNLPKNSPLIVAVGRDNRISSQELHDALLRGLLDGGCAVTDIGLLSTPQFYFSVSLLHAHAGIHVTASHNPPNMNGFKFTGPQAEPIAGEKGLDDIKRLAEQHNFPSPWPHHPITTRDTLNEYIDTTLALVPPKSFTNLSIVIDVGNGSTGRLYQALCERLSLSLYPLFFEPDGTFPHHLPDPLKPENTVTAQTAVIEKKASLGIAVDADGDRMTVIDEKGNRVPSDIITAFVAQELLTGARGSAILSDVRSSRVVRETVERNGGNYFPSHVGHSLIKRQMIEKNALFAGELSGHFYMRFGQFGFFEAPAAVLLIILNTLAHSGKPLSELLAPFYKYLKPEEMSFSYTKNIDSLIAALKKKYAAGRISTLDGLTVEYPQWWFNIRHSNTENVVRLNMEVEDSSLLNEKRKELERVIGLEG